VDTKATKDAKAFRAYRRVARLPTPDSKQPAGIAGGLARERPRVTCRHVTSGDESGRTSPETVFTALRGERS